MKFVGSARIEYHRHDAPGTAGTATAVFRSSLVFIRLARSGVIIFLDILREPPEPSSKVRLALLVTPPPKSFRRACIMYPLLSLGLHHEFLDPILFPIVVCALYKARKMTCLGREVHLWTESFRTHSL